MARAVLPDDHEPIGVLERQAIDEHGLDDREDRGVRADAERERQHGDGGEARRAQPESNRVAKVLKECGHERP